MTSRRRAIAGLAALSAGAWLHPGYAQKVHRIAVLLHGTERTLGGRVQALRAGLKDLGYVEGRNLVVLEDLTPKHLELLKVVAPGISRVAVLNTGKYLFHDEAWRAAAQTAQALKLSLVDVRIAVSDDLSRLASACAKGGCNALYVMPDPLTINWRERIVGQAAKLRLPAAYFQPEFVQDGGLMSYSPNIEDMFRRAAGYVDRILKGAKPGDLPIERPTKFELVINLTTAKSLGLTIPGDMLARADRVIR